MIIIPKQLLKRTILKLVFLIFVSLTLIIGCKKDSGSLQPAPAPVPDPTASLIVSSMSPSVGPDSTLVTFQGKGFGTIAANDSVSFNGKTASLISVSDGEIVARVPTLAGSGNVVVSINGKILQAGIFSYDTTYRFSVIASNIKYPWYLTMDDSSNLYFTNDNDQTLNKIDSMGNITTLVQNINLNPAGTVINKSGDLFVVSNTGGGPFIDKVNPDGTVTQIAHDSGALYGLAVDKNGNLYAANTQKNTVEKITAQGVVSVIASGLFSPSGIAVGKDGAVYITNYSTPAYNGANGVVTKITASGQVSTLATGIYYDGLTGIVLDDNDNLYVTSFNQQYAIGYVVRITPAGVVKTISTDVMFPVGIAMDHKGNLYVADEAVSTALTYGEVVKLTPH
jgi:streptogramin lyase